MPQWYLIPVPSGIFFLTEHRNCSGWEDSEEKCKGQSMDHQSQSPPPTQSRRAGQNQRIGKAGPEVRGQSSSQSCVTHTYLRHQLCWSWAPYLTHRLQQAPVSVLGLSNFCSSWNEPECSWCLSVGLSFWDQLGGLVPCKPWALAFIASWHRVWAVVECVTRQNF